MIYINRNRSNYATESQNEKKTCFNAHAGGKLNFTAQCVVRCVFLERIYSLKSLAMLKCESRTSLHEVQYKWQPHSILMFCSYYFRNG